MRELFSIDSGDYDENWPLVVRPSCRSIIIKDGKVALVHSMLYDYYKFPGGGMNEGESREETLIRETREEAGLEVIPDSIREYGYVRRKQKGYFPNMGKETIFLQDNYYYFVKVRDEQVRQDLDEYEDKEHFTLEYIDPLTAIKTNLKNEHGPKDRHMIDRETRVLSMLIREGHV